MSRVFNFSAGPSVLPESVLMEVQENLLDYAGLGMSVMEISHRSPEFIDIAERAERLLREIFAIEENYHVLFLQGGATLQFAMIPMNLATEGDIVEYAITGSWSRKAFMEASRLRHAKIVTESNTAIENFDSWTRHSDSRYLHLTSNETITGLQFKSFPRSKDVPLVVDMSSDFLTRPLDVSSFGLIYASAQKNVGPAGLTIVIVRDDLVADPPPGIAEFLRYDVHAEKGSMYNTPNTFAWYVSGLVFDWVLKSGGVSEMQLRADAKSRRLYDIIDNTDFYTSSIDSAFRSNVNVTFSLADQSLEQLFLDSAAKENIVNIRGHRSVGGIRASLYNAISNEAVNALADHMEHFEKVHG